MIFPKQLLHHLGTPLAWVYKEIFVEECYRWWKEAKPNTIVDLGANIGLASMYYRAQYPEAKIVCVEASPVTAQKLKQNLQRDGRIRIESVAVAGSAGHVEMWIDANSAAQLNSSITGRDTGAAYSNFHSVVVEAKTLDSLIPEHVDLMKVDIEGSEYDVLRAACVQPERVAAIVVEVHDLDKRQADFELLRTELSHRGYDYLEPLSPGRASVSRIVRFQSRLEK